MTHDDVYDKQRYFDFSDEPSVIKGFLTDTGAEKWKQTLGKELKEALEHENPIVSIEHLLAFSISVNTIQNRLVSKQLKTIRNLLIVLTIGLPAIFVMVLNT